MQSFQELNLTPNLQRAITELGFETPTPVQAESLPILLGEPTDFLGLAATGTGKTAAFAIPLLERIALAGNKVRGVQALILCPTRELAIQVSGQINLLGKHMGVSALPIYGGAGYGDQIYGLKRGVSVVVGTPGRVVDHLEKGTLKLESIQTLILDEADEMISMGFKDDLEAVLGSLPEGQSNIWLFSATMSPMVRKVADQYLRDPQMVQVNRKEMVPETVEQVYYSTSESNKPEVLCKIIDAADEFYGIIFCQTKQLVVDLNQYLQGRGYRTDCLHGDMDQNARERTMNAYRDRKVQILVATDVACRGLDVKDISHVVNYSLPRELDNYVHRIGRTGRSGKAGLAVSLVTPSHRGLISRIERATKSRMREVKIPTRREIGVKKVGHLLGKFQEQDRFARAQELMDASWKEALAGMSGDEIAARFLMLTYPEVFADALEKAERPAGGKHTGEKGAVVISMNRNENRNENRMDSRNERGADRGYAGQDRAPRFGDRRERTSEHGGERAYEPRQPNRPGDRPAPIRRTGSITTKPPVIGGPSLSPAAKIKARAEATGGNGYRSQLNLSNHDDADGGGAVWPTSRKPKPGAGTGAVRRESFRR